MAAVSSEAVVLLLFLVFYPVLAVKHFVSFIALQSSQWPRQLVVLLYLCVLYFDYLGGSGFEF